MPCRSRPATAALVVLLACSLVAGALHAADRATPDPGTNATPPTIEQHDGRYAVTVDATPVLSFIPPAVVDQRPDVAVRNTPDGWQHVTMTWHLSDKVRQDELAIPFDLTFKPTFHWMPHLAPEPGFVVGQHVFRSPAIIATRDSLVAAIVPDLDCVGRSAGNPWFMDLDASAQRCWLGMTLTDIPVHVGFKKKSGMKLGPGKVELAFYVTAYRDPAKPINPWQRVSRFLWDRWARPLYAKGEPVRVPMDTYVRHTYRWAFEGWKHVWQEFDLPARLANGGKGVRVGAPQFIVNVSQSPNYKGPWFQREFLSVWNQAWFSSLRSASGVARWARRVGDAELKRKADLTKALALAAPMTDGIFPAVIGTHNEKVTVAGKEVWRPKPWSQAFWTNSNRCPHNHGVSPEWYHVLDASWTCLLMLRWYDEIEKDPRLLDYARTYADKLLTLQDTDGFFPGWLHPKTLKPAKIMSQTPESAMSVTFLLKLAKLTGKDAYRLAALKALDALLVEIVPTGRWEDYETYWSCCRFGSDTMVGKKFTRNNMYKQNSLSMFWTAEALLAAWRETGKDTYLRWGRRTLDELGMCQQVWQPPFIYVPALGGFGVMNFDGEWNDSHQSLFAELFLDYYRATGDPRLFERGVAALKASFIMMYCPENPQQMQQYERAHPFFGPEDYGFMMENYGHGGWTSPQGGGIGPFTIYDWGNGAASEARNRIVDHYGDVYVDRRRGRAFGLDSIRVEQTADGFKLIDLAGKPRKIRVVSDDDTSTTIDLNGSARIGK